MAALASRAARAGQRRICNPGCDCDRILDYRVVLGLSGAIRWIRAAAPPPSPIVAYTYVLHCPSRRWSCRIVRKHKNPLRSPEDGDLG